MFLLLFLSMLFAFFCLCFHIFLLWWCFFFNFCVFIHLLVCLVAFEPFSCIWTIIMLFEIEFQIILTHWLECLFFYVIIDLYSLLSIICIELINWEWYFYSNNSVSVAKLHSLVKLMHSATVQEFTYEHAKFRFING